MEEIQSTGVLDREILEDARKKARRVLKTAEDQILQAEKEWEGRTLEALENLERSHAGRLENARKEIMARLPLDRRRMRLKKIDGLLRDAGRRFLESLETEKVLALLEREFAKRAGELGAPEPEDGSIHVRYRCIGAAELEKILEKYAGPWRRITKEEKPGEGDGDFPAFSVDSGALRITVSLEGILETLLDERREELAQALLGEEALDA